MPSPPVFGREGICRSESDRSNPDTANHCQFNRNMKLYQLFTCAASLLLFCGACSDDDKNGDPQPNVDAISVNPQTATVSGQGGKVSVMITSSGDWTLSGKTNDYVTPSVTNGKDGDVVDFTVKANDQETDQLFAYTFTCGEKSAEFKITLKGRDVEYIEITSNPEMRLAYTKDDRVAVTLNTDVDSRDLSAEISGADDGWLAWSIARPTDGGAETDVTAYFTALQNDGESAREATIKIKGPKGGEASLKITQLPKPQLETEKTAYFLGVEAQTLDIPVTTNLEFDVVLGESGNGWLTYNNYTDNALHFSVTALNDEAARECEVTLTEKNGPDNAEPCTLTIKITQKPKGLIEKVADMRKSRCYFSPQTLKNPDALNALKRGTMEALVNIQETRNAGSLSTIMGIENLFLLRLGDVGVPWNQIQMATRNGNCTDAALTLSELDRWYHIAVTWDGNEIKFYVDGKFIYSDYRSFYNGISLGVAYTGYESEYNRAFWIGYAYNADRTFPGYMSELRIWNRDLTEDELKTENHFYSVPTDSEGLVGYWKLDGGEGDVVKDYSPSGNNMVGEINVRSQNGDQVGDPGMNYVEMSLP